MSEQIAFPVLSREQIDQLRPYGIENVVETGDLLFKAGERGFDFFVVLEGAVEILAPSGEGQTSVTVHEPGEFTGDIDMVGGRSTLVTAMVCAPGRMLKLPGRALKEVIAKMPGLSDVILKAFLTRRALLMNEETAGFQLVGSRFSEATHRIKGFAERNDLPYTWLDLERDDGAGIYYGATRMEARLCRGNEIVLVGGGNSAGQAAMFLSDAATTVHMLLRSGDLGKSMSRYLVDRIHQNDTIDVSLHTEITALMGDDRLKAIVARNNQTGEERTLHTQALFSFIGAKPCTDWLSDRVETDANGFVYTGTDLQKSPSAEMQARRAREPFFLETSLPGVFAVGDARAGSVKRVVSAVGEGSMAVKLVHEFLEGSR